MEQQNAADPRRPTRRELVGGAALTGVGAAGVLVAAPALSPRAAAAPPAKPCVPDPLGVPTGAIAATPDGRRVWTTDRMAATVTEHRTRTLTRGVAVDVGGAPTGIAIARAGDVALVTTGIADRPGLTIVDLHTHATDRLDVGEAPGAVAWVPRHEQAALVVNEGTHGTLRRVQPRTGRVGRAVVVGAHPRGLAVDPRGAFALVALNGESAVAVVDARTMKVLHRIATAAFPAQVAIAPDGRRAVVTHNGYGARAVSLIDVERRLVVRRVRVGADPAGVTFSRSGAGVLVTAAGAGTATLLDGRTGRRIRTATTQGAPRAVAVAGSRAIVADGLTGRLSAVRFGTRA